jgi:hypothetical protein
MEQIIKIIILYILFFSYCSINFPLRGVPIHIDSPTFIRLIKF